MGVEEDNAQNRSLHEGGDVSSSSPPVGIGSQCDDTEVDAGGSAGLDIRTPNVGRSWSSKRSTSTHSSTSIQPSISTPSLYHTQTSGDGNSASAHPSDHTHTSREEAAPRQYTNLVSLNGDLVLQWSPGKDVALLEQQDADQDLGDRSVSSNSKDTSIFSFESAVSDPWSLSDVFEDTAEDILQGSSASSSPEPSIDAEDSSRGISESGDELVNVDEVHQGGSSRESLQLAAFGQPTETEALETPKHAINDITSVNLVRTMFAWVRYRFCFYFAQVIHDVFDYLGPEVVPLPPRNMRLLWRCVCGNLLFRDFAGADEALALRMQKELSREGYATRVLSNNSNTSQTHSLGHSFFSSNGQNQQTTTHGANIPKSMSSNALSAEPSANTAEEGEGPRRAEQMVRRWFLSCLPIYDRNPGIAFVVVHIPTSWPPLNDRELFDYIHTEYTRKRYWYHRNILFTDVTRIYPAKFVAYRDPYLSNEIGVEGKKKRLDMGSEHRLIAHVDRESWAADAKDDASGWDPETEAVRPDISEFRLLNLWQWRCSVHQRERDSFHSLLSYLFLSWQPLRIRLRIASRDSQQNTSDTAVVEAPSTHSQRIQSSLEPPTQDIEPSEVSKQLPVKIREQLTPDPMRAPRGWGLIVEEGFSIPKLGRQVYTVVLITTLWAVPIVMIVCITELRRVGLSVFGALFAAIATAALILASGKYFEITGKRGE